MYIEELENEEEELVLDVFRNEIIVPYAKHWLIGAGARLLFYPTLLYNVVRNKIQSEFRWWDEVDEFILLGVVPFPTDVPQLEQLGVHGVITLNEPYETLVPTSLYHAHGIDHLVIPTRDYLFAPSYKVICQAVDFIHKNASSGKKTYVHCKAGRGRSTTVVLCYLVQYKQMTPDAAYKFVRSIRPRVLLASSQWQAVQEFYVKIMVKKIGKPIFLDGPVAKTQCTPVTEDLAAFEDGSIVVVTELDLDGYDGRHDRGIVGNDIWAEVSLVCRVQFASQAALSRLSCLWLHCVRRKMPVPGEKLGRKGSYLGRLGVGIHVC